MNEQNNEANGTTVVNAFNNNQNVMDFNNSKQSVVTSQNSNVSDGVLEQKKETNELVCPNCGFKLNEGNKMCLHCGQIFESEGESIVAVDTEPLNDSVLNNKPIYILNLILFVLSIIGIIVLNSFFNLDYIVFVIITLIPFFFYSMCIQILLKKAKLPWWGYFIPIYNTFLISKMMTNRYSYFFRFFIPSIVLFVLSKILAKVIMLYFVMLSGVYLLCVSISMVIKFAKRFDRNWILMLLFPEIMIPWTALSSKYECE